MPGGMRHLLSLIGKIAVLMHALISTSMKKSKVGAAKAYQACELQRVIHQPHSVIDWSTDPALLLQRQQEAHSPCC